ncbi:hypothetical protein G6F40_015467 [Rhizopus arrhizus]|nr:hypothetical protein G6F40_015467 [Rhizopus arrhizus]
MAASLGLLTAATALLGAALSAAAAFSASAPAAEYPDHPIRWLVPFSPGGGSDLATRIVATPVGGPRGPTVVGANRPGAATIHPGAEPVVVQEPALRAVPQSVDGVHAGEPAYRPGGVAGIRPDHHD